MLAEEFQFHAFFSSAVPKLWKWQDDGQVIAWHDGTTISFRQEVLTLLERTQRTGLPTRFGALVLLLAACRDSWTGAGVGRSLLQDIRSSLPVDALAHRIERTLQALDRIHSLKHFMANADARAEMAEMVFLESHPKLPDDQGSSLISLLRSDLDPTRGNTEGSSFQFELMCDLHCLSKGLDACNLDDFAQRLQTGIEDPLRPAPVDLPPAELARGLIDQLQDDERLGGVARLARLLLAAVRLPTSLSDPDELRITGVSDITNRGTLDRLLLSELANDDLTLATRVALNEALYLRRERIDRPTSLQRFVLVDSGLRMWGIPRVYAAAIGLAVVAQSPKHVGVSVYHSSGEECVLDDFTTADGLSQHLSALDFRAHPGKSFSTFGEIIRENTTRHDGLIITGEDVWSDYEFAQAVRELDVDTLHIAMVNRSGQFQLAQVGRRGTRIIGQAHFDLDEVFAPRSSKKASSRLVDRTLQDLPAIFHADPFPLRLPTVVTLENSWNVEGVGVFSLRADGNLFLWDQPNHGAQLINSALPPGRILLGSSRPVNSTVLLVVGKMSEKGMYTVHYDTELKTASATRLPTNRPNPLKVFGYGDNVFVAYSDWLSVFDGHSGALLRECEFRYTNSLQGRYFPVGTYLPLIGAKEWAAISYDGGEVRFDRCSTSIFPSAKEISANTPPAKDTSSDAFLLSVFDIKAMHIGPVGIERSGQVFLLGSGEVLQIRHKPGDNLYEIAAISRNGTEVILKPNQKPTSYGRFERLVLFDETELTLSKAMLWKSTLSPTTVYGHPKTLAERHWFHTISHRPVRTRFNSVFVDEMGRLTLESRKGVFWPLTYDRSVKGIMFPTRMVITKPASAIQAFEPFEHSVYPDLLKVAKWDDGSEVYLDRRGMLHLRSWDRAIPETTIVLTPGAVAGWTSDGEVWGADYFVGKQIAISAEDIHNRILKPFAEEILKYCPF